MLRLENKSWNKSTFYCYLDVETDPDRINVRNTSMWKTLESTARNSYTTTKKYLWAYAKVDNTIGIPICIGIRNSSTANDISYKPNINMSAGKIWSLNNNNYLSLDGRTDMSSVNDRAYLASSGTNYGYVSVGGYKASTGIAAEENPVEIYSTKGIALQPGSIGVLIGGNLHVSGNIYYHGSLIKE